MKIGSFSEGERRQWSLIIERPFTPLAALLVFLLLTGGFIVSLKYSETEQALYRFLLVTVLISMPAMVAFAINWRRERRKPYAKRIRRHAWKIMLGIYFAMIIGALLVVLLVDSQVSRKVAVLAAIATLVPTGLPLFRLLRESEEEANQSAQPTR